MPAPAQSNGFSDFQSAPSASFSAPIHASGPSSFSSSFQPSVTGQAHGGLNGAGLPDGADADLVVPVPDALSGCLQDMEIQAIKSALARVNGNVSAAARLLGVSRNTIYRKIPELAQRPQ